MFSEAIDYYKKQGFYLCAEKLATLQRGGTFAKTFVPFQESDLHFDKLITLATFEGTRNKLKYREKDIAFLTIWQENLNRSESDINKLIESAIAITQNSYSLSDVVLLKSENKEQSVLFNNSEITLSQEKIHMIFEFFQQYKRGFLTNRTDKNFLQFMPIVETFGRNRVVTMIGIPISDGTIDYIFLSHVNASRNFTGNRVLLSNESLVTLKFACNQLVDVIKQIANNNTIRRMNEELEQVSMTDYLTGIYNRHGLSHIIETKLNTHETGSNLILYIDLDNFKYYNDTFGHELGDFVLVQFTDIIIQLIGDKGYAVRYGGDEFVIVLPEQTEEYGIGIANQIYEHMKDGLKETISQYLKQTIVIPPDKKLSCSIGITEYTGSSHEDIETALNNADQALYFIKRNSKGHAITWSKLKDFTII